MITLPRRRTVADVMTTAVHVAGPQTQFKLLVRLIEENRISAIPIVDLQGIPIGVVSESDLLVKEWRTEVQPDKSRLHLWRHETDAAKADGVVAADLMTSPAITVPSNTTIPAAARLMHERTVKRLVVVDGNGRIAGIVSRSDLLRVFLRGDEELRDDIVDRVIPAAFLDELDGVEVDVHSNVVTFSGEVERKSDIAILASLTRDLDGVVDVITQLSYRWDDGRPPATLGPSETARAVPSLEP